MSFKTGDFIFRRTALADALLRAGAVKQTSLVREPLIEGQYAGAEPHHIKPELDEPNPRLK